MRLHELALLIGVEVPCEAGDPEISGVASLLEARPGELSFYGNPRYLSQLRITKASVVIVSLDLKEEVPAQLLRVANPSEAFAKVLTLFQPDEIIPKAGVHPSAIVAASAKLGTGVSIGALSFIGENVHIGEGSVIGEGCVIGSETRLGSGCRLYPGAIIRERCILGDKVILQPGAVIGSCGFGYELIEGRQRKIPQMGIVEIGNDVEIGANTTIDRARFGRTAIGEGSKIDNLVQIAHNVQIGPHSIICSQVGISGSTRTGSHVTLAGQVGLAGHLEIGDNAILGAKAGVSKNVPAGSLLIGAPAKPMKEWKEMNFYLSQLHKLFNRVKELEKQLQKD